MATSGHSARSPRIEMNEEIKSQTDNLNTNPVGIDDKENIERTELNERQEKFCQLYATETEFFGNGVQSYLEVPYDIDKTKGNWYKTACAASSQLLSNIKVCKRINELLKEQGLNDEFTDKQLLFLITQHADFGNKLGAIREYNKLKQRIINRTDVTSGDKPLPIMQLNVCENNSNGENNSTE